MRESGVASFLISYAAVQGDGGFIMLDDPLVHCDKDPMAVAVDVLSGFSGNTQVIFFTCHDQQAERLEGVEGHHYKSGLTQAAVEK